MINKIVRRSLLKTKTLLFAVFILFMLAIALLTVSLITYSDVQVSFDKYKETSNFEDFRFYAIEELQKKYTTEFEEEFENEFDVSLEKTYYTNIQSEDVTYGVTKYEESSQIDKLKLVDGEFPTGENEILLTPGVMERKNISIGQDYEIADQTYKVVGSGYIPEYTFPVDVKSQAVSIGTDSFIPIYMDGKSYLELDSSNDFYYRGKFNNGKPESTKEIYKQMTNSFFYEVPLINEYGLPQITKEGKIKTQKITLIPVILSADVNPAIGSLQNSIDGDETMFKTLAIVIIIIALLITIILFNSIFNSQKREIGIQKAEGISEGELGIGYLKYLSALVLLASIVGFAIGVQLKKILVNLLLVFYSVPLDKVQNGVIISGIITVLLVNILLIVLVYFIAIRRNLKTEPLLLIKNIEKEKKVRFNFNFITKNLNFINKYKFNILIRTFTMSILLAFGVFVSSFLLIMGGVSYSTMSNLTNSTYGTIYTYDYKVTYSPGNTVPKYDNNSMISQSMNIEGVTSDTQLTQANSVISLISYNYDENEYINLQPENKNEVIDSNTIYITTVVNQRYDLEEGDVITVQNPYDTDENIKITVGGILDDSLNSAIYMDLDKAHNVFELDDDYANAEVGVGDKKDEILEYDKNASYSEQADLQNNLDSLTQVLMVSIFIISFIAIIISFITLSMINSVVIKKNKKTISVMKVLGYTNKEISNMTTSAYKWILIVVYLLSIPIFEKIIQIILQQAMADMDISIKIHIGLKATIFGFVIILFVYYLSLFIAKRNINKISLSESLKADE